MDRYPGPGYPLYPSPRPSSSRWPEPEYVQAPPQRPMRQSIMQYHPYPVPKLSRRKCQCDGQLNVIQEKVTTIQTIVTNIATKLNAPLEETGPDVQSPEASSNVAASASPSPTEQEPERLQYSDVVIPTTSKERKELIRQMEQELEQRREQNKEHEQRIAGLREELEQLRSRKK